MGVAIAALLNRDSDGEWMGDAGPWLRPAVAIFVLSVGLLAAAAPARRGLRMQPTEGVRED